MQAESRQPNLIDSYLHYVGDTESPVTFHRWSMLTCLSAWLGNRFYIQHGHSRINSNMYVMLMGEAGTRKSTAIKLASKLVAKAGYKTFSSSKCSKEQFLVDLAKTGMADIDETDDILDMNLFGEGEVSRPISDCEIFVNADEFNDFVGNGNIEFLSLLGNLWDIDGDYTHSKLTSKSVYVRNPCVSVLAGNTATGFSLAFPKEAIGQGIFSRLLLVQGDATGKRIAFPRPPNEEATAALIKCLLQIRSICNGEAILSPKARVLLEKIYLDQEPFEDVRFASYHNRRFTHLLKLSLITAASHKMTEILPEHVLIANTTLVHAEHSMSRALGEFGMAFKSTVSDKIMRLLTNTTKPLEPNEIWKHVNADLNQLTDLRPILEGMLVAEKIIRVGRGFIARRKLVQEMKSEFVDFSVLTEAERSYIM